MLIARNREKLDDEEKQVITRLENACPTLVLLRSLSGASPRFSSGSKLLHCSRRSTELTPLACHRPRTSAMD